MKQYASIFNDVIGPVMRGPSSSHTAAAVRIGMLLRQMIKGNPEALLAEFDPRGSLAATYHTQGSDIGLAGGLMGMEITDGTLLDALEIAAEKNIEIVFSIVDYEADHPQYIQNDGQKRFEGGSACYGIVGGRRYGRNQKYKRLRRFHHRGIF